MNQNTSSPQTDIERKHLTILTCDLVGSTSLSEKLDPEELRTIIIAYQDCVLSWLKKYDGFFAQFAGDAVWAYFGYPTAHEDDACRAIRAALGMVKEIPTIVLPTEKLNIRVGIASGLCVVGSIRKNSNTNNQYGQPINYTTALGSTPNLAARLQTIAEPGQIVVSEETQIRVGTMFELDNLGSHIAKGFTNKIPVWLVRSENIDQSKISHFRLHPSTKIVGRDAEINELDEIWTAVKKSNKHIVNIWGEPGIGKSTILASFIESLELDNVTYWWFHCNEYLQNTAFAPVLERLRIEVKSLPDDPNDVLYGKIIERFPFLYDESIKIIGELFKHDFNKNKSLLSAARKREKLILCLLDVLEFERGNKPLIIIVEDTHWIDPSTNEFIASLIIRFSKIPILVLLTSRTPCRDFYLSKELTKFIEINSLPQSSCRELINQLYSSGDLPDEIVDSIVEKTDGVPLFIEDLVLSLINNKSGTTPAEKIESEIPGKLSQHLMARIDKLSECKEIAQVASIMGREFSIESLIVLTRYSEQTIESKVQRLIKSDLIIYKEDTIGSSFQFKHALIRDAAYESILHVDRRRLHNEAASWLIDKFEKNYFVQPEIIAFHLQSANESLLAAKYWLIAGQLSNDKSNYAEAFMQLNNARMVCEKVENIQERNYLKLEIITAIGVAQAGKEGISGDGAGKVFQDALVLCKSLNYPPQSYSVFAGAGSYYFIRADYTTVVKLSKEVASLARKQSNDVGKIISRRLLGAVRFIKGDYHKSIASLSAAIEYYDRDPLLHSKNTSTHSLDHKTTASCYLSLSYALAGNSELALSTLATSVKQSENINNHSLNCALCYYAAVMQILDAPPDTMYKISHESFTLAMKEDFSSWIGMSQLLKGYSEFNCNPPVN